MKQLRHDALHSTIASVCGTAVEIFLCYGWANGYFYIRHKQMSESPWLYIAMSVLVTHLRVPHFYAIHRMIHPWRVSRINGKLCSWYFFRVFQWDISDWSYRVCILYYKIRYKVYPMSENSCIAMYTACTTKVTIRLHLAAQACMLSKQLFTILRDWCQLSCGDFIL